MANLYSDAAVSRSIVDDHRFRDIERLVDELCAEYHDYSYNPDNPRVRLHEPTFGAREINAALAKFMTTQVTMGQDNLSLEALFAKKVGVPCSLTSNSGSSANLLAISALCNLKADGGLRPGDEVIVSALSWSTTIWPLAQHGLVPVIVDIDDKTLNISVDAIGRAITERTKAVMVVHVYGNPCDMTAIQEICEDNSLYLIEDCCEALGATYSGQPVGSFGALGTFSFYYSHHITTLEGGITVSKSAELDDIMRVTRAHGWIRESTQRDHYINQFPDFDPRFLFVNHGYNLRITDVQAAIGLKQLDRLDDFVRQRRLNAEAYSCMLSRYEGVLSGQWEVTGGKSSWFGFPIIVNPEYANISDLTSGLNARGIETRPIICGNIAAQPAMKLFPHRVAGSLENSTNVMRNGFSIGCHHAITGHHIDYVSESFLELLGK